MDLMETARVVGKIQLGDNRHVDDLVIREWHDTIGHLTFEDAINAVTMHRQESTAYLMPSHVIAGARRLAQERAMRQREAEPGSWAPKPNNFEAMTAAYRDPVAFAREKAVYNEQLRAGGHRPLYLESGEGGHWADGR